MKILCVADLHILSMEHLKLFFNISKKSYDLMILHGDISELILERISEEIVPYKKVIGVLGNHDSIHAYEGLNIENINGKVVSFEGLRIAGIEGSFKYKEGNFPAYTHGESYELADKMGKADILITHTSPYQMHKRNKDVYSGLAGINHYIIKNNPVLNIHGHQHRDKHSVMPNGTEVLGIYRVYLIDIYNKTIDKVL